MERLRELCRYVDFKVPGWIDDSRMTASEPKTAGVETLPSLPTGPVADKLSIWPLDSGQYGLDASFQGRSGYKRMEIHEAALAAASIRFSLVQELGDAWTLRFGPLSAAEVAVALRAFVH